MAAYEITTNRRNGTRELVEVSTGRVIDQADMDNPRACVELTARCEVLNAQAAAAELAAIEAEATQLETAEAFAPALVLHYNTPATVEAPATPEALRLATMTEYRAHYIAIGQHQTAEMMDAEIAELEALVKAQRPAPVVTRAAVLAAVETAREACTDSPSWFSAVSKAAVELELGRWLWDGSRLIIGSRTRPNKRYTVTADTCTCGHRCKWHKAAYRLLQLASSRPAPVAA